MATAMSAEDVLVRFRTLIDQKHPDALSAHESFRAKLIPEDTFIAIARALLEETAAARAAPQANGNRQNKGPEDRNTTQRQEQSEQNVDRINFVEKKVKF